MTGYNHSPMRQHVTTLVCLSAIGGCSLIYNPSNLPDKSVAIDAPIADVNPALLRLDERKSPALLEGAGQDGSQPQILVVYGEHITQQATVKITSANSAASITVGEVAIANDGNSFAALVKAGYMDAVGAPTMIPLTIEVSQPGAAAQTIDWSLQALDELRAGTQAPPPMGKLISRVDVTGDLHFETGTAKAIVKAVGGITVTGMLTANANGRDPGAGGCFGGIDNQPGECFGAGGAGATGAAGGGAGFAVAGAGGGGLGGGTAGPIAGDDLVRHYGDGSDAAMNRSAGGGGGSFAGGGGGGTLELTAGGNITVPALQAVGGTGGGGALGGGGGGGAGGVIVLRAGGTLAFPATLTVKGGDGGNSAADGGAGAVGRWRYDAAMTSGNPPAVDALATPAPRRGPMIVRPADPIFRTDDPTITIAGEGGVEVTIITIRPDGAPSESTTQMTLGTTTTVRAPKLAIGLNKICVIVPGGSVANDEATNCIDVARIP